MTEHDGNGHSAREVLAQLATPEHRAGFWDDVERRLAATGADPVSPGVGPQAGDLRAGDLPDSVRELGPVLELPPSRDRRPPRRRWLVPAAAVALVVAAAVGVTLAGDEGRQEVGVAVPDPTDPTTATTPDPTTATTPETVGVDDRTAAAQAAALEWLDLLAAGDMRAAWDRLSPATQGSWESFDAFAAARSAFSEGFALWATAENRAVGTVTVEATGGAPFHVVTITGVRRPEGTEEDAGVAIVVREDPAARLTVEPFAPAGSAGPRFTAPVAGAQPAQVASQAPVTVATPGADADVRFVLDRSGAVVTPEDDGAGNATYLPPGGWSPGRHTVTAVVAGGTGAPMAIVVVFEVG